MESLGEGNPRRRKDPGGTEESQYGEGRMSYVGGFGAVRTTAYLRMVQREWLPSEVVDDPKT